MSKIKEANLHYKEGSSDKVYHVQLLQGPDWFSVHFQYGRRGGTLASGIKIADTTLAKAEQVFAALVKEKTGKGYQHSTAGIAYSSGTASATPESSGFTPQLLTDIVEVDAPKYLKDKAWFMQEKFDGRRLIVSVVNSKARAVNKKGLFIDTHQSVLDLVLAIGMDVIVDGELVGENYHIFDLLSFNNVDKRQETAQHRYELLKATDLGKYAVPTYFTYEEKLKAFNDLRANKKEGAVFKQVKSAYVSGRPASGGSQLKCKFWDSATVYVSAISTAKRSVSVCVFCDEHPNAIDMGKVTIPPNYDVPEVGDIVEVEYLYCNVGGALYQSKYRGKRDDQDISDCNHKQLKFKQSIDEDDTNDAT